MIISTLTGEEVVTHTCKKCGETKPVADFEHRVRGLCGPRPLNHCKVCRKKAAKELSKIKKYTTQPPDDHKCPLCLRGREELGYTSAFVFEHNHETGLFRNYVCHDCNNALARIHDSLETAKNIVKYLETDGAMDDTSNTTSS